MTKLGSKEMPLKVAIVGSGPSGFYAAEALLNSRLTVEISMIERLPVPFGLVRSGVAPDHPRLKQPALIFERIALSESFRFFGNVRVGTDINLGELSEHCHAVILAYGANTDNRLEIPGEDLPGSWSATEFVGWYNGHPDYRDKVFDLGIEAAVIVGQGNVALDVARILAKPIDELRSTDIAAHALEVLAESKVRDIYIVGRRGPAQAKFASPELEEIGRIPGCAPIVQRPDLELGAACVAEAASKMNRRVAKNLEIFSRFSELGTAPTLKRIHFEFFRRPIALYGKGKVSGAGFVRTTLSGEPSMQIANDTSEIVELPCQIVFRSVGYRGTAIPGVAFDEHAGTVRHANGRLHHQSGQARYGLYATGWIKRGASGIIGTNRADSVATIDTLKSDIAGFNQVGKSGSIGLESLLRSRGMQYVSFAEWKSIDQVEVEAGRTNGKPREKFTRIKDMLSCCPDFQRMSAAG